MRLKDADALVEWLKSAGKFLKIETDHKRITHIIGKIIDHIEAMPTIDPESLRKKGEWKNGVCTICQFDLRCLTDGESDLEQWVWDEGFDCGADMRGNKDA